jgi:hypothetical protein
MNAAEPTAVHVEDPPCTDENQPPNYPPPAPPTQNEEHIELVFS